MPRYPRRSRLKPGVDLDTITIKLSVARSMPVVELSGRALTGNPRVDAISRVVVTTALMTPAGQQFIGEMVEAFAGAIEKPEGKNGHA
jgi:hypothetical protein